MNGFDIVLVVLVGVALFVGLVKGLTRLLIGTGALIAAFMLAAQFHQEVATRLTWIDLSENVLKLIAYLLIFLGTMLAGGLVAWVLRKMLKAAMLSWADRLAGGAVGVVAATLVAALLIVPLVAYSPFGERALRDSVLAPYVMVVADLARRVVPRDLAESYQKKVEGLRQYWRERWQHAPELEARRFAPAELA